VTQCSENEIYDVYIRDDDTLLRTELECRVWSAEVVYRPLSLMIYEDVQLRYGHLNARTKSKLGF